MLMMKKKSLIIVMVAALLTGGALTALIMGVGNHLTAGEGAYLSAQQYEEYQTLRGNYSKVQELRAFIEENYYIAVDDSALEEGLLKGLFRGLNDPYSAYLNASEYDDLMVSTTGEYSGIGVTIEPGTDGYINVVSPMDGSPAQDAGIKAGDKIIGVNGQAYDAESIDAAVSAMRGEAGTHVTITVLRGRMQYTMDIERGHITTESVRSEMLEDSIGYIRISSFEKNTASHFEEQYNHLAAQGMTSFVLDIRSNPGGLVEGSVEIADFLLPEGIITYTENRKGEQEYYNSKGDGIDLPFVVLIDGGSASSSEILAAAVKDSGAARLVGTTTYGKGIIQRIDGLAGGDATKLTVMQYFSPKGNVIHSVGVEPDVELALTEEDFDAETGLLILDTQLEKAKELLREGKE